jgi:hypothetical protein
MKLRNPKIKVLIFILMGINIFIDWPLCPTGNSSGTLFVQDLASLISGMDALEKRKYFLILLRINT